MKYTRQQQKIANDIDTVNRRIETIYKKFGGESAIYKDAVSSLSNQSIGNYLNTKNGYVQISKQISNDKGIKRAVSNKDVIHSVNATMKKAKTLKQLQSTYGEGMDPFEKDGIDYNEIERRYNLKNHLDEIISRIYEYNTDEEIQNLKDKGHFDDIHKSWDDFEDFVNDHKDLTDEQISKLWE